MRLTKTGSILVFGTLALLFARAAQLGLNGWLSNRQPVTVVIPSVPFRVPLVMVGELPFVNASWAGHEILTLVDTGSTYSQWPGQLDLPARVTGTANVSELGGRMAGDTEFAVLPSITIGGLQLRNVRTIRAFVTHAVPAGALTHSPVLGMDAFRKTCLTLDVRGKWLTIGPSGNWPARLGPNAPRWVFPIRWDQGTPRIPVRVFKRTAWVQLDTGCVHFVLSGTLATHLPSLGPYRISEALGATGPHAEHIVRELVLKLGNITISEHPGHISPGLRSDGLLGADLFYAFRVTIDAPRSELILEPYNY